MEEIKKLTLPLTSEQIKELKAGDKVEISGIMYTGRDAAHKRMYEAQLKGETLPISLEDNIIYYLGPTPAKPGQVIGSAGPTTASRMDKYTPLLLDQGQTGMIGKGKRSPQVIDSMKKNKAVYFAEVGGAGALVAKQFGIGGKHLHVHDTGFLIQMVHHPVNIARSQTHIGKSCVDNAFVHIVLSALGVAGIMHVVIGGPHGGLGKAHEGNAGLPHFLDGHICPLGGKGVDGFPGEFFLDLRVGEGVDGLGFLRGGSGDLRGGSTAAGKQQAERQDHIKRPLHRKTS